MSTKLVVLVLAANLALFSCAPKDDKLVKPGAAPGVTATEAPKSPDAASQLLLLSFDRQVEALHYLKLTLSSDYAVKRDVKVSDKPPMKLVASELTNLSTLDYTQTGATNFIVSEMTLNDDQTLKSLTIKENPNVLINQLLFVSAKMDTAVLKVTPLSKLITVTKVVNKDSTKPQTYNFNVESYDLVNTSGKVTDGVMSDTFTKFTIEWDGKVESLNQDIKIVSALVGHAKGSVKFIATSLNSTLIVKLTDECTSQNGMMTLRSTDKKDNTTYPVTFNDSSISIAGRSTAFTAAACASRPVVDIRKLF